MRKTPKRIWLDECWGAWQTDSEDGEGEMVQYIRADIVEDMRKALKAALGSHEPYLEKARAALKRLEEE